MADTKIEWADKVWNPVVGCSVISPGCTNCYAMRMAGRLARMGQPIYQGLTKKTKAGDVWVGKVETANWGQVTAPLHWKKPRRIFVNSMSDLFHEALPDAVIDQVFAVMAACPQHQFMILTKRAARMREYAAWGGAQAKRISKLAPAVMVKWPLPNVWLGVSVEDRERKAHIDDLRATPAAVRFISFEPLLEDVGELDLTGIDQVITGGESGPRRRPHDVEWQRSILKQARAQGCAFFGKQDDKVRPLPPDLMVREWPKEAA